MHDYKSPRSAYGLAVIICVTLTNAQTQTGRQLLTGYAISLAGGQKSYSGRVEVTAMTRLDLPLLVLIVIAVLYCGRACR